MTAEGSGCHCEERSDEAISCGLLLHDPLLGALGEMVKFEVDLAPAYSSLYPPTNTLYVIRISIWWQIGI
jgi:hypothetical protein